MLFVGTSIIHPSTEGVFLLCNILDLLIYSYELKIPESYIPKITKKLKEANIITACEGIKGGYSLVKKTEDISLFDIISSTEVTMKLNRCLEEDGFCSRNATEHCKVHKILLDVQQTYDNLLKGIKVSEIIKPDADELSE